MSKLEAGLIYWVYFDIINWKIGDCIQTEANTEDSIGWLAGNYFETRWGITTKYNNQWWM